MSKTVEAVLRLQARLGSMEAFSKLANRLGDVDKKAAAYNRTQSAVAKGARDLHATMLRYAAPAVIGGALINSVRQAGDFEETLFGIQKKLGISREEMAGIKGDILDLAGEIPVSIEEIAAAFERGAAAGVPIEDLREFAKLTTAVAEAWDASAESVGNYFSGFQSGLGLTKDQLEPFADLINYLADSGIADETGIADFIDRAGASLRNFGLSADEIAAYGAALQNLKMPSEVAARALDTLAGKLAAPENLSEKSRTALQKIVGDIEAFQAVLAKDAGEGLMFFLEKLEKLDGRERASLLGALMGEGFDDEVARIVAGIDEVRKNLDAIENREAYEGSIAGLSDQRLDMLNAKLQLMANHIQRISTGVGEIVADPLNDLLGGVSDAVDYAGAITTENRRRGLPGWRDWVPSFASEEERDRYARAGGYVHEGDEARAEQDRAMYAANAYENPISLPTAPPPSLYHGPTGGLADEGGNPGMNVLAEYEARLAQSGQEAGRNLGETAGAELQASGAATGQSLAETAIGALQSAAAAIGAAIGQGAASHIDAATRRAEGAAGRRDRRANANTGQTMTDAGEP